MRRMSPLLAFVGVLAVGLGQAAGAIVGVSLGTSAPPGALGAFTMTAFPDDTGLLGVNVSSLASPLGGDLAFSPSVNHRQIGAGWATWSHGYTGDVYFSNGATSVTLSMPAETGAFYFYAEPNPFALHTFVTVETASGVSVTQDIHGSSGAAGFGFYTTDLADVLSSITVSSDVDFALGEFGIARTEAVVPEVASFGVWAGMGAIVLAAGAIRRRTKTS
ncbi:MAG: hypothetical protein JW809_16115 [Pirellulales bacterium]|nr:hypothetical protein [Pirellulales bacterium]